MPILNYTTMRKAETAEKLVAVLEAKFRYILRIDDNDHTFQPPQEKK
jgi:CRISPR/Cas system CSM-associated protein Csm2 small subunit